MKKQGRWQELLRLMGNKGKIAAAGKLAAGAASITVLSVGGHHVWKQMQFGTTFRPELFANSQALHGNQITFPENEEYKGNEQTSDPGENEQLQRDRRAEEDLGKQKQDKASFEMDAEDPNAFSGDMQNLLVAQDEQNPAAVPPAGLAGNAVLLTDGHDAASADTIYAGGSNGISTGNTAGSGSAGSSASETGTGSGSSSSSDSSGGAGNGGGSGTNGGGSADTPQPSNPDHPTPSPDPVTPVEPDHPSDSDKVYDPDYPDGSKQPEPPKGPTWNGVDEVYPDFPSEGLSGKYSAELFVTDLTEADEQPRDYLYEGAVLTDWKLLCSALFYMNVYEDGEAVGRYRLKKYDDCFRIGDYPQYAKRGLTVTFYFRPNTECEWQEQEVTFDNIKYAKYVVVNAGSSDGQAEELMSGYLDEGESASLSEATLKLFAANPGWINDNADYVSQTVTKMFPGWSLEPNGELLHGNAFTPQKGGRYILYPLDRIPVPSGCTVEVWHGRDEDYSEYYRQVLTQFYPETNNVVIPDGIQEVQCAFPEDMETLYIPETVQRFFSIPRVSDSYQVSEYSPFFQERDGVLYNGTGNQILGIPLKATTLDVPEEVESIDVPYLNSLQEITLHSMTPPTMDINMLDNVKIHIPAGSYLNYLTAWGSRMEGHLVFETEEGEDTDYSVTKDGVFSADGRILRQASASCYGLYVVPDKVEQIEPKAFEKAEYIDSVMIPDTVKTLDTESLNVDGIERIYLYGSKADSADTIPSITEDTFAIYEDTGDDGETEYIGPDFWVPKGQKEAYVEAWKDILGEAAAKALIHEGFSYQTNNGITWLETEEEGAALIHVEPDASSFEEINELAGEDLNWTRIGARAFGLNFSMTLLELPETVMEIDTEAFTHCVSLEVVLSDAKDYFQIGRDAFKNITRLKFIAFDAKEILFERGSNIRGTFPCYVPDGNIQHYYPDDYVEPYRPNVTPIGFSNSFVTVPGDEGYFVYGLSDSQGNSTLIGATSDVSGTMSLPADGKYPLATILSGALIQCGSGEIRIPQEIAATIRDIGREAFAGSYIAGNLTFSDELTSVGTSAFSDCEMLESIHFNGENPPALILPTPGVAYQFGFENADPQIEITVSNSEVYREDWKYYLSGYTPDAADSMKSEIMFDWDILGAWMDAGGTPFSDAFEDYAAALAEYRLSSLIYPGDVRACELLGLPEPEKPALEEPDMDDYLAKDAGFDWFAAATPSNAELADEILDEDEITDEDAADEDDDEDDADSREDAGRLPSEIQNPYYIPTEDKADDAGSDGKTENAGTGSTGSGGKDESNAADDTDSDGKNETDGGADTSQDSKNDQADSGDDSTNGDTGSAGDADGESGDANDSDADTGSGSTDEDSSVDAGESGNNESAGSESANDGTDDAAEDSGTEEAASSAADTEA